MGLDFRLQTYIFTMHVSRVCAMYILILILVPFKDIEETSLSMVPFLRREFT